MVTENHCFNRDCARPISIGEEYLNINVTVEREMIAGKVPRWVSNEGINDGNEADYIEIIQADGLASFCLHCAPDERRKFEGQYRRSDIQISENEAPAKISYLECARVLNCDPQDVALIVSKGLVSYEIALLKSHFGAGFDVRCISFSS